jgi:hypothetical protein
VLYTVPAGFGERVWLWLRAGITPGDPAAARDIPRAACWAGVQVVVNDGRSHIVVLEVKCRLSPDGTPEAGQTRPGTTLTAAQADGPGSAEPIAYAGYGHLSPFG